VSYDTQLLLIENDQPKVVSIGQWADAHLDNPDHRPHVQLHGPADANMELLNIAARGVAAYVPSCDADGRVRWCAVTNVTRHDPSPVLYKITTRSGRAVTVVQSESLLVWDAAQGQLKPTHSDAVRVGDLLPVTVRLPAAPGVSASSAKAVPLTEDAFRTGGVACPDATLQVFLRGVLALSNTIAADGSRTATARDAASASCLALALARFGIFTEVLGGVGETLVIPAAYAGRLAEADLLGGEVPQDKAQALSEERHDVCLDPIASIDTLSPASDPVLYRKVYDLTVPDTLNFQLFNGLNVRDTSDTGYIQRKLVKAMEDCKVNYDGTVRNATGSIVQFLYGEDGMDGAKLESQPLPHLDMDLPALRTEFLIEPADVAYLAKHRLLAPEVVEALEADATSFYDRAADHFRQVLEDRATLITEVFHSRQDRAAVLYPIAFHRILTALQNRLDLRGAPSDLHPGKVLRTVDRLCEELGAAVGVAAVGGAQIRRNGTHLLQMLLRLNLSPKRLLARYRLNQQAFEMAVQQIRARFHDGLVHASEMVGVIAAQSIGSEITQLTLNTFHASGIASASAAVRGVPRLRELLSVTKNMKTPIMTIRLRPDYAASKQACMDVLNELRTVRFRDITTACKIYFDPDPARTHIREDQGFVDLYNAFRELTAGAGAANPCAAPPAAAANAAAQKNRSPWLLRLTFDKAKLLQYRITMLDIHRALVAFYDDAVSCVFSDDSAEQLVFRIQLRQDALPAGAAGGAGEDAPPSDDLLTDLRALEHNILDTVTIKGVKSIERVSMHEEKRQGLYRPEDGTFVVQPEWVIDTDGSNLVEVLGRPFVDARRTVTNNVPEIYQVLGVEAARAALYAEIVDVLVSVHVDYRHIALLVDTMTNKGHLLSIDRHGINRGDIGPLAKCSFEEVNDMLIKAGVFAEADKINGVSANIILGQIAPCGTGDGKILVDEAMLMASRVEGSLAAVPEDLDPDAELEADAGAAAAEAAAACSLQAIVADFDLPDAVPGMARIAVA
jgi:hypothetical protein